MPPQETLKHSKAGVAQSLVGSLGPGAHKVLFEPSESLWRVWGLILHVISPLLPSCWGFSFALGCGVSFFGGIQHFPANSCSAVAAAAELLQSCPTLCSPIDGSPPGSPIPGILKARTLEWVAISFSNA